MTLGHPLFLPPVPTESRVAQHKQMHTPAGQLAAQQPGLLPPASARVAAEAQNARDVRDRHRDRRARRRDPNRGGLLDREL